MAEEGGQPVPPFTSRENNELAVFRPVNKTSAFEIQKGTWVEGSAGPEKTNCPDGTTPTLSR